MSKILSTALFVSCATAQLTTSAWMPGGSDANGSLYGSVINVEKDRTTLSLSISGLDALSDVVDAMTQTITVAGNTYYGFNGAAVESGVTINVVGECSRKNTDEDSATCSISTKGFEEAMSSMCAEAGVTEEMCASGAIESNLSTTLPSGYFGMGEVIVTAGEDLLPSASAAQTPSPSSASATASRSPSGASSSAKPTSGSESAASSGGSRTSEPSAQSTNAAPLMTMAPALAGLGAAAAAFFL